jgi:phosphatidylserine/phosphatidylglycerophosphate/cardiolipin synthase-like enzyme
VGEDARSCRESAGTWRWLNFEIMAVVADPAFNTEVEQMLLADMEKSVEMQPGDLANKSFWFRLGTRLARLTSPVQ